MLQLAGIDTVGNRSNRFLLTWDLCSLVGGESGKKTNTLFGTSATKIYLLPQEVVESHRPCFESSDVGRLYC